MFPYLKIWAIGIPSLRDGLLMSGLSEMRGVPCPNDNSKRNRPDRDGVSLAHKFICGNECVPPSIGVPKGRRA